MNVAVVNKYFNALGHFPVGTPKAAVVFPIYKDASFTVQPGDYVPSGKIAVVHYNISVTRPGDLNGPADPETIPMFRLIAVNKDFTGVNWGYPNVPITNVNTTVLSYFYKDRQGEFDPIVDFVKPISENISGKIILKQNEKLVMVFGQIESGGKFPEIGIHFGGHFTNFVSGDTAISQEEDL